VDISVPVDVLPDSVKDVFYSGDGEGTLMFIFFNDTTSADETLDAVAEIRKISGEQCFLSSMSAIVLDTKNLIQQEMVWYVVIAAGLTAVVLSVTMDSFLVPVIILLNIGLSILYNLGTNFIKGEISFITMALVAVLQLGVTMDYSIFLYSSFKEQKGLCADREEAMSNAIAETIVSITGSSLTTVAGFIALCFMSFTLGMDLGIVMAKGVILGVISCVTLLPALMLVCDKAIEKTSHPALKLNTEGVAAFVLRHYKVLAIIMVILWIPAVYGYNNTEVYYKLDESLPASMGSVQANKALNDEFDMSSISMILVDADLSHKDTVEMLDAIKKVDGVNFALGLDSVIGSLLPDEIIPQEAKDMLQSDNWKLMLVSSAYEIATDEVNAQCDTLSQLVKSYDPNGMLIGETACTKDLIDVTAHDFAVVSSVSIGAIFILILLVLKSALLPVLLVIVIELAIYINMGSSFYLGQILPFIASVCVGTIQLGATVDYAILMTTRYKKERMEGHNKEEAAQIALSTSIHSIMTSAMGFFAATVGVGLYSSADLVGAICVLLARGAIISMFVVVLMLPSMYMLFDKLICRTTIGMRDCIHR
jgi:predicted RND superfamily exporter protein